MIMQLGTETEAASGLNKKNTGQVLKSSTTLEAHNISIFLP